MNNKWLKFKENIKNPPLERLTKIEYQSHFINIFGVIFASIVLTYLGYWYVIFAFIFSVGVSYSQGMQAYQKYKAIRQYQSEDNLSDFELETSPTRKRTKLIQLMLGKRAGLVAIFLSVVFSSLILNPFGLRWYQEIAFFLLVIVMYLLMFFFVFYYVALYFYKRNMKGGRYDENKKIKSA